MIALFSEIYLYLKLHMLLNSNYCSYGVHCVQL